VGRVHEPHQNLRKLELQAVKERGKGKRGERESEGKDVVSRKGAKAQRGRKGGEKGVKGMKSMKGMKGMKKGVKGVKGPSSARCQNVIAYRIMGIPSSILNGGRI
jgi:hypothetical protein